MPTPPDDPLRSLPHYLRSLADLGARTALIDQRLYRATSYSYAQILGQAFAFQARLAQLGIQPGDRVLLQGSSGAAWAIAFYGCVLHGAVVVPLDAAFSPGFAQRVRQHTEAKLFCADHAAADFSFDALAALPVAPAPPPGPDPAPESLLEIVYTSGATADPKGVMITHANLLANLRPIAAEVAKYKSKARLFLPLRFLHLIPLSHLFGQVMGLFIPPLLDSAVVYPETAVPAQWAQLIRRHRASVMVCVPQQLQLFAQWAASAGAPTGAAAIAQGHGPLWRWWRFRKLHRTLGFKMWAFIVGGAALAPGQEEFFHALGFALVQGYGLTETAPAIAITHPFKIRRGAVGRKLAGVDLRIAPDGEILVSGGNVSPGYYRNPDATRQSFENGWLHTGDLGRLDENGNLHFLGRKKEVIVTADGLNVYPEDVERQLDQEPEIAESAAVEGDKGHGPQVVAVAVLREGAEPAQLDQAVARANRRLEPHQRIRAALVWPQPQLPRTASTHKLKRAVIAAWAASGGGAPAAPATGEPTQWRQFLHLRWSIDPARLRPEARLDTDLGLGSLDRVELLSWLEAHAAAGDESTFFQIQTVAGLDRWISRPSDRPPDSSPLPPAPGFAPSPAPALPASRPWPLRPSIRALRAATQSALLFPALRAVVTKLQVENAATLASIRRPVLFVANHQSMLDVPVILRALPREWRRWLAPAMGADLLDPAFSNPRALQRWLARLRWRALRLVFNTFLLSERASVAAALHYAGQLADRGFCPLIFPEGARTRDGRIHSFRPGIGVFVANLGLPVVPVTLTGLFEILPTGARRPLPGPATVRFGPSLDFAGQSPQTITGGLEDWYRRNV